MATFSFDEQHNRLDMTLIENLFIEEYMRLAPGDFIKVYLYGLYLCTHASAVDSLATFADRLGLTPAVVRNAFTYWQREGILKCESEDPLLVQYFSLAAMFLTQSKGVKQLYQYRDFNQRLQLVFGTRLLQTKELNKFYELLDVCGFPQETVLLLAEYCVGRTDTDVSITYIVKTADTWMKKGIQTAEQAQLYLQHMETMQSLAAKVLKHLRQSRLPTLDEQELAEQWVAWGMQEDFILYACKALVGTANPNLKYLSRVLEGYKNDGIFSVAAAEEQERKNERTLEEVKRIFTTCKIKKRPNQTEIEVYNRWRDEWAMPYEILSYAAQIAAGYSNPWNTLLSIVSAWYKAGVSTLEQAQAANQKHTTPQQGTKPGVTPQLGQTWQHSYSQEDFLDIYEDINRRMEE